MARHNDYRAEHVLLVALPWPDATVLGRALHDARPGESVDVAIASRRRPAVPRQRPPARAARAVADIAYLCQTRAARKDAEALTREVGSPPEPRCRYVGGGARDELLWPKLP